MSIYSDLRQPLQIAVAAVAAMCGGTFPLVGSPKRVCVPTTNTNTQPVGLFDTKKSHKMSITVWPEPIWIKVKSWWQILMQDQSTYPRGPESASIEILPFRPHFINFLKTVSYEVNLASQCSHLRVLLWSKFLSEREDFNWCRFWAS